VPSNLARRIVDDLMKFGEVRRGTIGYIGVEKLTPQLAEEGAPRASTARWRNDAACLEAYDAGLRPGDVIVAFNGHQIDDPSQFSRLSPTRPSDRPPVKVRNGRTISSCRSSRGARGHDRLACTCRTAAL
jgi:S1-C subfamily serine protease